MQVILVQCSSRLMDEKLWNTHVFFTGINSSKRARMSKPQMKTVLIIFFDMKCIVHFEFIPQSQQTKLITLTWKYWAVASSCGYKEAWTLTQRLDSPPWQCSSSEGALCQELTGQNWLLKCNTHPIPLIWLQMAISKNKVCLKGTKILGFWRHPKNVTTALKAVPQQEFVPKIFPAVATSLG
jgi:hypothetical protein